MTTKPRLVADRSLPYLQGLLDSVADLVYLPSEEITRERLIREQAEGLLIRSVTHCNKELLEGTAVRAIATATAGFDHIDAHYCAQQKIHWSNSPGCNARSVAHWVMGVLADRALHLKRPLRQETLAIVGVGNVGKNVQQMAETLGMKVLCVDPLRAEQEGTDKFCTLHEAVQKASIITFHTPLTRSGAHPTYHLLNKELLQRCHQKPLIINAARGAIADSDALLSALAKGLIEDVYLDCWEGEPHIRLDLLAQARRATPHIAGFSADGKARGTRMVAERIIEFFQLNSEQIPFHSLTLPSPNEATIDLHDREYLRMEYLLAHTMRGLPLIEKKLRQSPGQFESLRVHYDYPREAPAYHVIGVHEEEIEPLCQLGYLVVNESKNF